MPPSPPDRILLLGDDIGVYLAVARSLGRRGLEVHVVPPESGTAGLSSKYIAAIHPLTAYQAGAAAWLEAMQAVDAEFGYRLIIPCSDDGLMRLERHAASFGRERLAIPNPEAFAAFTDK